MLDLLWGLISIVGVIAAVYQWFTHHDAPRTPSRVNTLFGLGTVAVAFAMQTTVVQDLVDGLTGRPATGQHIGHLAITAAACCAQVVIAQVTQEPDAATRLTRRLLLVFIVVEGALVTLFVTGADDARPHDPTVSRYGVAYAAIYTICFAASALALTTMSWRLARWTDQDYVRCGMRLVCAAYLAAACYAGVELGFAVARAAGHPASQATELLTIAPFMVVGAVFGVVENTFVSWAPRVPALRALVRWLGRRRSLRVLWPLWSSLYEAMPDLAFEQPRSRWSDLVSFTGLDRRLHRRVIEIEDGLLRLRSHRDPAVEELAAAAIGPNVDEQPRRAVIEATAVAAALTARAQGQTFPVMASASAARPGNPEPDAEMAWLRLVSLAYRHSRVVPTVLAQLEAAAPGRRAVPVPADERTK